MAIIKVDYGNVGGSSNAPIGQTFNAHVDDQGRIPIFVYDVKSITIKGYSSGGYSSVMIYDAFTGGNSIGSVASQGTTTLDVSNYDVVYLGTSYAGGGTAQITFDS